MLAGALSEADTGLNPEPADEPDGGLKPISRAASCAG
jgi:hypothetical protein